MKDVEFYALCREFRCINNEEEVDLNRVSINCEKMFVALKMECYTKTASNYYLKHVRSV